MCAELPEKEVATMNRLIKRKGQSLVEFCLILPILLMILLGGIIDFGYAFYNFITLQQIANDSAMFAANPYLAGGGESATGQSESDVRAFIASRKPAGWDSSFQVDITTASTTDSLAIVRKVTLDYRSPLYTPFWKTIAKSTPWRNGIGLHAMALFQVPRSY